jgi:hypothetical protein
MAYYRLYFVERGHFVRSDDIEADSDLDALREASLRVGHQAAELWCGERKVRMYNQVER